MNDNQHMNPQIKLGRRKLRTGSLIIIFTMLFNALLSLYFVTTVRPEIKQFRISPNIYSVLVLISIPLIIMGAVMMIRGYLLETKEYRKELKKTEEQLHDIISKTLETK